MTDDRHDWRNAKDGTVVVIGDEINIVLHTTNLMILYHSDMTNWVHNEYISTWKSKLFKLVNILMTAN